MYFLVTLDLKSERSNCNFNTYRGKSSRMNFQNKSFLKIHNKTFIELLLDQLKILGYEIIINVNDDEEKYLKFGYEIVADKIKGRKGPLAGLHSIMSLYKQTKKIFGLPCFPLMLL